MEINKMTKELEHFVTIADLFEYPSMELKGKVNAVQAMLDEEYPEAGAELQLFTEFANTTTVEQQQEIYTRTFDVQAITTMDCGYLIFGDDYKRGELLSNLNREHKDAGNELHNQLGDHIPNLLRLLPKLKDEELTEELVTQIIKPALSKILAEFDPDRIKSKNELYKKHHQTLIESSEMYARRYVHALKALYIVLCFHFTNEETLLPESSSDFLRSITNEIELEQQK